MREICKSGSEGGARQTNVSFLPLSFFCAAKSNFKGTMVLFADDFNHMHDQISFERA